MSGGRPVSGGLRHPFGGALYALTDEGNVWVDNEGRTGVFRPDGSWVEGELREADPQFCGWIAGDRVIRRGFDKKSDHS